MTSKTILTALSLLAVVGCSSTSDKGAIPATPEQRKLKQIDNNGDITGEFRPEVDILLVVDDSGSMEKHQAEVAANMKLFTQVLSKTQILDYHIGVVTTSMDGASPNTPYDPNEPYGQAPCDNTSVVADRQRACGDGRLVRWKTQVPWVDRNTPNGLSVLEQNVVVGTNGSAEEHSFDPIYYALTPPLTANENQGFFRPDASLAIIFITDSEDQSRTMNAPKLIDFLTQLKGGKADHVMAYGALVPTSLGTGYDLPCKRDEEDKTPVAIESVIAAFKGQEYNICDADFGTKLGAVAKDVVDKVGKVMYLARPPVVSTIVVTYGTQTIPNDIEAGWTYDPVRNALIFGDKLKFSNQPAGTKLEVNFTSGTF